MGATTHAYLQKLQTGATGFSVTLPVVDSRCLSINTYARKQAGLYVYTQRSRNKGNIYKNKFGDVVKYFIPIGFKRTTLAYSATQCNYLYIVILKLIVFHVPA